MWVGTQTSQVEIKLSLKACQVSLAPSLLLPGTPGDSAKGWWSQRHPLLLHWGGEGDVLGAVLEHVGHLPFSPGCLCPAALVEGLGFGLFSPALCWLPQKEVAEARSCSSLAPALVWGLGSGPR